MNKANLSAGKESEKPTYIFFTHSQTVTIIPIIFFAVLNGIDLIDDDGCCCSELDK